MKPKDKAFDIYHSMRNFNMVNKSAAKMCSLIAIDELIESSTYNFSIPYDKFDKNEINWKYYASYWVEVKQETIKL